MQRVKALVEEVKLGSQEQARGIERIAKAVIRMQQMTQKAARPQTLFNGHEIEKQANGLTSRSPNQD